MFNNKFTKRYKNIPVAKFSPSTSVFDSRILFTPPEIHKEFEIILIKNGIAELTVDNRRIYACSGDMILINPYTLHSLEIPKQENFSYSCVCFDLSVISSREFEKNLSGSLCHVKTHIKSDSVYAGVLSDFFAKIESGLDEESPQRELSVCGNINLLFDFIIRNSMFEKTILTACDKDFCIRTLTYIEENYTTNITSETASSELGYNQSYFCRLFKKNFSMCFSDFVNVFRIDIAKRLLENEPDPVTRIAEKVGFSDSSYFSKIFRELNGTTPTKYRNSTTNNL